MQRKETGTSSPSVPNVDVETNGEEVQKKEKAERMLKMRFYEIYKMDKKMHDDARTLAEDLQQLKAKLPPDRDPFIDYFLNKHIKIFQDIANTPLLDPAYLNPSLQGDAKFDYMNFLKDAIPDGMNIHANPTSWIDPNKIGIDLDKAVEDLKNFFSNDSKFKAFIQSCTAINMVSKSVFQDFLKMVQAQYPAEFAAVPRLSTTDQSQTVATRLTNPPKLVGACMGTGGKGLLHDIAEDLKLIGKVDLAATVSKAKEDALENAKEINKLNTSNTVQKEKMRAILDQLQGKPNVDSTFISDISQQLETMDIETSEGLQGRVKSTRIERKPLIDKEKQAKKSEVFSAFRLNPKEQVLQNLLSKMQSLTEKDAELDQKGKKRKYEKRITILRAMVGFQSSLIEYDNKMAQIEQMEQMLLAMELKAREAKVSNLQTVLEDIKRLRAELEQEKKVLIKNIAIQELNYIKEVNKLHKDVKRGKAYKKILKSNEHDTHRKEAIQRVIIKQQEDIALVKKELTSILNEPLKHETSKARLGEIKERRDEAGMLARNYAYVHETETEDLYHRAILDDKPLANKYLEAKQLAEAITVKYAQIEVLDRLEENLNDLRSNNNNLDSLRSNPLYTSVFVAKSHRKNAVESLKTESAEREKEIKEMLEHIQNERKRLYSEIKKDNQKAREVQDELLQMRRDLVAGKISKEQSRNPADRVELLSRNIVCELQEHRNRIEMKKRNISDQIGKLEAVKRDLENQISSSKKEDTVLKKLEKVEAKLTKLRAQASVYEMQNKEIITLQSSIRNVVNSDLPARQKLDKLRETVHTSKITSIKHLDEVQTGLEKGYHNMKRDFVKQGAKNDTERLIIRNRNHIVKNTDPKKTVEESIDHALTSYSEMIAILKNQRQYLTDKDYYKNELRIQKYENAQAELSHFKQEFARNHSDPQVFKQFIAKIKDNLKNQEGYVLPDTTQAFLDKLGKAVEVYHKSLQSTQSNRSEAKRREQTKVQYQKLDSVKMVNGGGLLSDLGLLGRKREESSRASKPATDSKRPRKV